MQQEMPLFQEMPTMIDLPVDLVARCNELHNAVALCLAKSRVKRPIEAWAKLVGTSKGNLGLLLNGGTEDRARHFPPHE